MRSNTTESSWATAAPTEQEYTYWVQPGDRDYIARTKDRLLYEYFDGRRHEWCRETRQSRVLAILSLGRQVGKEVIDRIEQILSKRIYVPRS